MKNKIGFVKYLSYINPMNINKLNTCKLNTCFSFKTI